MREFSDGSSVWLRHTGKRGTVERLRDDAYERGRRARDPTHFYYSVTFDDGTFDTYVPQSALSARDV
jgi:hypothetical protein